MIYLCHFRRLDLLDFEEIAQSQEGDGHGTDTDHEHHQWWAAADVDLEVLQRVYVEHYSGQAYLKNKETANWKEGTTFTARNPKSLITLNGPELVPGNNLMISKHTIAKASG